MPCLVSFVAESGKYDLILLGYGENDCNVLNTLAASITNLYSQELSGDIKGCYRN